MFTEPVLQLLVLQVALPSALIILNAILPTASVTGLLARFLAIGALLSYLSLAGVWLFPPSWSTSLLGFLHIGGTLIVFARYCRKHPQHAPWRKWGERIIAGAATVTMLVLLSSAIAGRVTPQGAIDLATPLAPGRYLVVSGGKAPGLNAHLRTLDDERFRAVRGQSFAVDLIGVDALGFRTQGIAPKDPRKYRIYGATILAPCAGTIVGVTDGLSDMPVPQRDRAHLAGNHVLLDCKGYIVVLAHMAPGSIGVKAGDVLEAGARLGEVGNSGNTDEPHLHMHVQRDVPETNPLGGEPLWFTVGGRFLTRNDILTLH
ncbi:MAG: M23 family metallopeptidase [Hyphomonadaceae bacterium]|nr:M23 family metallopeptidase [Hyphomonadaceae bacterium]